MNSSNLLSVTTFIYGLAALFYISSLIFKKPGTGKIATLIVVLGLLLNSAGIAFRWTESYKMGIGHAPFSNLYESLVLFSWIIIIIYLTVEYKYKNNIIGAFSTLFAFLAMAYAALSPNIDKTIQPLVPALKSNWLITHVFTCFLGYAAFTIAFGTSVMYLINLYIIKKNKTQNNNSLLSFIPDPNILDELTYEMVTFGFLFLSLGIITGSVWANSAWGSYWSWDPKETWSLITWLIYSALLHARLMRGWQGKRIAYLSIIGFIAVIFTYFGVNYLPGLHSYGK